MKNKNYIDGKVFLRHLIVQKNRYNYHKVMGTLDTFEQDPYVIECYQLLCKKLSGRYNFSNYTYREDMISEGVMNCFMYWHNFNPDKSTNVFAYFTTIASQAFVRYIKKEKRQTTVKEAVIRNMLVDTEQETSYKKFLEKYVDE